MKKLLLQSCITMLALINVGTLQNGLAHDTDKSAAEVSTVPGITQDQLKEKLGKVTLVDALKPESFERSHIKGSVSIPIGQAATLAPKVLPQKDAEIVVYCMTNSCRSSEKVAGELKKLGYKNLSIYRDGLRTWVSAGLPVEGTHPQEPESPKSEK